MPVLMLGYAVAPTNYIVSHPPMQKHDRTTNSVPSPFDPREHLLSNVFSSVQRTRSNSSFTDDASLKREFRRHRDVVGPQSGVPSG